MVKTVKKNQIYLCAITATLILLAGSGCVAKTPEKQEPAVWSSGPLLPEGMNEIGVIAGNGEELYYTAVQYEPMGQFDDLTRIYRYTDSGGELLYEISGKSHLLNEMVALDHALFWIFTQGATTSLQRYDLADGTCTQVCAWKEDELKHDIILCGQERWLTWYEESQEGHTILYGYDDAAQERFMLGEIGQYSMYTRHPVHDGMTAFLDAEQKTIHVYNLENRQVTDTVSVPEGKLIRWLEANESYIFYALNDKKCFYQHDRATGEGKELSALSDSTYQIFSCHLIGDMLIVNDRNSNQLFSVSLKNGDQTVLTEKLTGKHTFVLGACAGEEKYIILDGSTIILIDLSL